MTLGQVIVIVSVLWVASEIALSIALRSRGNLAPGADRSSLRVLWITITCSIAAAGFLGGLSAGRLPGSERAWAIAGLTLMVLGIAIRWAAILTLRRAFTVDVAIASGQTIVERGLYRVIRHPSYAGSLVSCLGLGMIFDSALSIAVIMVPITIAFLYRIRVEEAALHAAFGEAYARYVRRSRRLVPFVY
jgi:protein-S-isoprenylcysteine O-methyltransferase Ste14